MLFGLVLPTCFLIPLVSQVPAPPPCPVRVHFPQPCPHPTLQYQTQEAVTLQYQTQEAVKGAGGAASRLRLCPD